jgi:ATP-dependent DNA helicase RecG
MLGFLAKEALGGNQVFWVVPQIGPSVPKGKAAEDPDIFVPAQRPVEDLATVDKVKAELESFSREWKVGAMHGKMPAEKKEAVLSAFRRGELHALVATTVIEVGVDVPQANLMVIESPDRFGVAQLHQLRGRTGRGSAQAWCFLSLPPKEIPPETYERLASFAETSDGFAIAEMDLKTRGAGALEGTDQSGYGGLRFTDLIADFALTQEIRAYAEGLADGDAGARP